MKITKLIELTIEVESRDPYWYVFCGKLCPFSYNKMCVFTDNLTWDIRYDFGSHYIRTDFCIKKFGGLDD